MKKITSKLSFAAFVGLAIIAASSLQSCSKSSSGGGGGTGVTPLGGYVSSDSVAPTNLVAYWPFDGSVNDVKGSETGTPVNVTYTTGIRGQAYQGAVGAYATVAPSTAFNSLSSYSLSVWYKVAASPTAGDPQGLFFLSGTTNLNELIYELDVPDSAQMGTDSIKVHHGFDNLGSAGWQAFTMEAYDTSNFTSWIHLVTTYDASTSTYIIYQDGTPIANSSAFGKSTSSILYQGNSGTAATTIQGNLSWTSDPPKVITIGTWPATLYGVSPTLGANGCFIGQMDELRIYNKALTQQEVAGLFLNGQAGR